MSLLDCQPKDAEAMAQMEENLEARLQKAGRELIERDRARYVYVVLEVPVSLSFLFTNVLDVDS